MQHSQLRWLCRRGMKELDTAMSTYLAHHYDAADAAEQALFAQLLQEQDPEIMVLINEPDRPSPYRPIIRKIRDTLGAAC